MEKKDSGFGLKNPKNKCEDSNCPFHGILRCRGRSFTGTIISAKMQKTVTVEWEWKHYIKKYERYESRRSRVKAHNPSCINAKDGEIVKIIECRPLSKTKNFVVVEISGREKGFAQRMEAETESKFKREVKEEETKEVKGKKQEVVA